MAKLFFTLVILYVFGGVMVKGHRDTILQTVLGHLETCKAEVEADDDNIRELMHNTTNFSMKAKCLFACIMKKMKLMDENGKFVKDVALTYAKNNTGGDKNLLKMSEEIINICADIPVDDNHCEAAVQYANCIKEQLVARHH
ncbi:hypothetical protein DOY81_003201 [Sarcophaga bullata]|nr:hypothetical protein DOY81_003201 [Sarcophaga bullata]